MLVVPSNSIVDYLLYQVGDFLWRRIKEKPHWNCEALDLEAMAALEFLDHFFFNTDRCGGAITNGELHIGMQFKIKDDAIIAIKHHCAKVNGLQCDQV